MNLIKKQINILEFLKPTWGKLTVSLIFLLIFFLLPWLGILLKIRFVIIFWLVVVVIVSLPLFPIIKALGLTTTSPIYFDMAGGPTLLGLVFIGLLMKTKILINYAH